jgi:hypothetical protein
MLLTGTSLKSIFMSPIQIHSNDRPRLLAREWLAVSVLMAGLTCVGGWALMGDRAPALTPYRARQPVEMQRVYLDGAVSQAGWVRIPVGSRRSDLPRHIKLHPEADQSWIESGQKIKDGEALTIPYTSQSGLQRRSLVENEGDC